MSDKTEYSEGPRKVLLATDSSARGDRALERAVLLAQKYHAHLVIVHVIEEFDDAHENYGKPLAPSWRLPADADAVIRRRIRESLREELGDAVEEATVLIEEGEPAQVIEQVAIYERADLVVTGIAREGLFASRPVILGRTVERLMRQLPVPILIARNRAKAHYKQVVAATDLSEPSAFALQAALRLFPSQPLNVLHAATAPYEGLVSDPKRHVESFRGARCAEIDDFLNSIMLPEQDRKRLIPWVESGSPQKVVRDYVQMRGADLVVLGTHGRGAVLEAFVGSNTKNILSNLPCDALIVRGPRK